MGVVAMMLTSCSTPKPTMTVFKDLQANGQGTISTQPYRVTLRPQDELIITVTSLVPSATAPYNLPLSNPATQTQLKMATTPHQQTYVIDHNGDIDMPVLGKVHVAGKTVDECKDMIAGLVAQDVTDPQVYVKLVNFTVNVVGEVTAPRRVDITGERFSILDALASAGSFTEYGDRTNVMVIREENGNISYNTLDLTKSDVISSPYYYLQQNDVVMVSPTSTRESNARYDTNNAYRTQIISTIVSAASVIASLVIAMTVN